MKRCNIILAKFGLRKRYIGLVSTVGRVSTPRWGAIGLIPGRKIPKSLKMVIVASSLAFGFSG